MSGGEGEDLYVPGSGNTKKITNAIPLFDDIQVHKFMRRHTPTVLELSASIGMRRMIADVPMTHAYTIIAGAWYCADMLLKKSGKKCEGSEDGAVEVEENVRSHVDIVTCWKLFGSSSLAFGKYFNRIFPYLTSGKDSGDGVKGLAEMIMEKEQQQ
eukprot:m.28078 g.28078  ORF g.28078 m.28078 type:complete len:156 (+) comp9428_c0_seq1:230-697(+)